MPRYRRPRAGDPPSSLSARALNAAIEAGEAHLDNPFGRPGPRRSQTAPRASRGTMVKVKNTSAAAVGIFGVMGIDGVVFEPHEGRAFFNDMGFNCVEPTEDHRGKFVITAEPVGPGKVGNAWLLTTTWAKLYVVHEKHRYADVWPGRTDALRSDDLGACEVLWTEATAADRGSIKWAIVKLNRRMPDFAYGEVCAFRYGETQDHFIWKPVDVYGTPMVKVHPIVGGDVDTERTIIVELTTPRLRCPQHAEICLGDVIRYTPTSYTHGVIEGMQELPDIPDRSKTYRLAWIPPENLGDIPGVYWHEQ